MERHLPIFPLETVLYPGLVLPLHVFEPRYRALVNDLLQMPEGDRRFGVVAIRQGREAGQEFPDASALHQVGCVAQVRKIEPLDDDRFALATIGTRRFRLSEQDRSRPYLQADVDWLEEADGNPSPELAKAVSDQFGSYRFALTRTAGELDVADDPRMLSYLVAAAAIIDLGDKQRLLEAPDTATRLRYELALLQRETALLNLLPSLPAVDLSSTSTSLN